jgi:hypothetical protein
VDLHGGAYERGEACGRAFRDRIAAHMEAWREWLANATGLDASAYVRAMLRDTDYVSAIQRHAPDLLEEVRGVADGAGLDRDLVYGLQLMDEEWFHRVRAGLNRRIPGKCSSLAIVQPGGPTWIGQNMDLGDYTDGHQVVLRIGPDGEKPGALVFTTAGVIALMGVNDAGVGVCVNSLPQLPSAPEGVPVAFVIRRLLQARNLDEASEWVQAMPHATNQHYLIAEPGAVRSFECSAAGVNEYHPADPSRVLHTNHPLADVQGEPEGPDERRNSAQRLASLSNRLASGSPGLAELQAAFSACDDPEHPVCRTGGGGNIGFTCGSMLSALPHEGGAIRSWVSAGPPIRGYTTLELAAGAIA